MDSACASSEFWLFVRLKSSAKMLAAVCCNRYRVEPARMEAILWERACCLFHAASVGEEADATTPVSEKGHSSPSFRVSGVASFPL